MARAKLLIFLLAGGLIMPFAWHAIAQDTSSSANAPSSVGGVKLLELPGLTEPASPPPTPVLSSSAAMPANPQSPLPQTPSPSTPSAAVPPMPPQTPKPSTPSIPTQGSPTAPNTGSAAGIVPSAPAAPPAAPKPVSEVDTKNPDLILEPLHLGDASMFFDAHDNKLIIGALDIYDGTTAPAEDKDDVTTLLDSIKTHKNKNGEPETPPPPLPNLYLGSIVYYTPNHWSVWINGRKIINSKNQASNEFYVDRLSASEIELVWKPAHMLDVPVVWKQLTKNQATTPKNVSVDIPNGSITLRMRPNQTFLPKSLAIREGLIKSSPVPPPTTTGKNAPLPTTVSPPKMSPALPSTPQHILTHDEHFPPAP